MVRVKCARLVLLRMYVYRVIVLFYEYTDAFYRKDITRKAHRARYYAYVHANVHHTRNVLKEKVHKRVYP